MKKLEELSGSFNADPAIVAKLNELIKAFNELAEMFRHEYRRNAGSLADE